MKKYDGFVFGKLRIPCHVYQDGVFSIDEIICRYNNSIDKAKPDPEYPYLTQELVDLIKPMVKQREEEAKARGAPFFDGRQVRLEGYGVDFADEDEERKILTIDFGPSTWFRYNATNKSLDTGAVEGNGRKASIREKYVKDPLDLKDNLANSTGVSTTIISSKDGRLLYVQRSEKLSQYPAVFGDGAAGFMNRDKDLIKGVPNPFYTVMRETKEEAGIPCKPEDFVLLGVGRAMDDLHGEIWMELRTNHTVDEIKGLPKSHKYETVRILDVPFEPKEVAKIFKEHLTAKEWEEKMKMWIDPEEYPQVPAWVPAHAVNTIHSLIKEYGFEPVRKAFEIEGL